MKTQKILEMKLEPYVNYSIKITQEIIDGLWNSVIRIYYKGELLRTEHFYHSFHSFLFINNIIDEHYKDETEKIINELKKMIIFYINDFMKMQKDLTFNKFYTENGNKVDEYMTTFNDSVLFYKQIEEIFNTFKEEMSGIKC